jgi:hypothetical protein
MVYIYHCPECRIVYYKKHYQYQRHMAFEHYGYEVRIQRII